MSSAYTIAIPEPLLEKAQRVAEQTARGVDDVILATLRDALDEPVSDLPEAERTELRAMVYLSDDALWTIARERMPQPAHERMGTLMAGNTRGDLSDAERAELAEWVERGNRLSLRKAQAMKVLTGRGYRVALDDLKPANE